MRLSVLIISLIAYPEREQNVAAGIDVEHTVDDYGAGAVQGPAVFRDAIHRGVVARRVEFQRSVRRRSRRRVPLTPPRTRHRELW